MRASLCSCTLNLTGIQGQVRLIRVFQARILRHHSNPGKYAVETWPFLQHLPPHLQPYLPPLRAVQLDAEQTYLTSLLSADPESPAAKKASELRLDEKEKAWALAASLREGVEPTAAWLRWCIGTCFSDFSTHP